LLPQAQNNQTGELLRRICAYVGEIDIEGNKHTIFLLTN